MGSSSNHHHHNSRRLKLEALHPTPSLHPQLHPLNSREEDSLQTLLISVSSHSNKVPPRHHPHNQTIQVEAGLTSVGSNNKGNKLEA